MSEHIWPNSSIVCRAVHAVKFMIYLNVDNDYNALARINAKVVYLQIYPETIQAQHETASIALFLMNTVMIK